MVTVNASAFHEQSVMHVDRSKGRVIGVALRVALLSWMTAMVTLLVFVLLTIPQQKKMLFRNLESKANGVAVSLHDAAAGAAINEDFASVVSASEIMIKGDPEIDFLIVMKNDGFSLLVERTGWRAEPYIELYWSPAERKPASEITKVPRFDRRVFHYAQPFDYSGIQWGWIHVGFPGRIRPERGGFVRNTVFLGIGCIVFSLFSSLLYANRLVRPILRLREIVRRIAGGDLSVRAETFRQDELGSLAKSVNTMTDALLRRDRILERRPLCRPAVPGDLAMGEGHRSRSGQDRGSLRRQPRLYFRKPRGRFRPIVLLPEA